MNDCKKNELQLKANKVRQLALEGIYNAKSGHPGGSLSATDILTYLYFEVMNVNPDAPKDPDRDRFVLSKGHGAPALYGVLALKGFFGEDEVKKLRSPSSMLQGHPDMKNIPGIDMSTGSLGQGISAACGMAKAAKIMGKSYMTYAVLGDGELEEGQVWEAAMFASMYKLDNLIAFVDNNGLQIDGKIEDVCSPLPIGEKFKAFNWNVYEIDGHDFDQIEEAVKKAQNKNGKPTVIVAKTVKGKGVSYMENNVNWHGAAPGAELYETAVKDLAEIEKGLN